MRQDWIEFEGKKGNKISLRSSWIVQVTEVPFDYGKNIGEYATISYECGNSITTKEIAEPYEQVKQKIMDAEKVDLSDVVVEHFTREEYAHILELFENATDVANACGRKASLLTATIMDKLYEILKEEE